MTTGHSPDHLPIVDFPPQDIPDEARIRGLHNLSPREFVAFISGLGSQGIAIEFDTEVDKPDLLLEGYRAAPRATAADLTAFAQTDDCTYPLAAKSVSAAWNALRLTHHAIQDAQQGKSVHNQRGVWVGRNRQLTLEQFQLFKHLPLSFVLPGTSQRGDGEGCELVIPSLHDTLAVLQERRDRTDFFQRISKASMLFLMDFTNYAHKTERPIRFVNWQA